MSNPAERSPADHSATAYRRRQKGRSIRLPLRIRVILIFILFSLLPLVILGVGSYLQLRESMIDSLERHTMERVRDASREMEERLGVARDYLPALGLGLQIDFPAADPGDGEAAEAHFPTEIWAGSGGPFLTVEVVDAHGTILHSLEDPALDGDPADASCSREMIPEIALTHQITDRSGAETRLVATVAPTYVLPGNAGRAGEDGQLLFLNRSEERFVNSSGCPDDALLPDRLKSLLLPPGRRAEGRSGGTVRHRRGDHEIYVSHATVPGSPWTVIATARPSEAGGAAQTLRTRFLLLVLGVGGLTSIGFATLLRPVSRSLADLTRAMGAISGGELNPWLPPPSSDEMGELSLATSQMASRIEGAVEEREYERESAFVGDMARHLAHEVRNPLSSIRLNLQSLDRQLRQDRIPSDYSHVMSLCLDEIHRLDQLVGEVLTLGRQSEGSLRPCSLDAIVEGSVAIVRPELEEAEISVDLRFEADRDQVLGDQTHLTALFVNLLLNSRQALDHGGRIKIRTRNRSGPGDDRRMWISVRVADDGPGIPPELRTKIFRPFFSTKKNGSGIGLAAARSVARRHGGHLYFEKNSELTPGAEFVLLLPLLRVEEATHDVVDRTARLDPDTVVLDPLFGTEHSNGR